MQKSENGLQCIVTGAAQKGMYFPWDSGTVCAVLTAGFCLLLAEAFPSVSYPWWGMAAAALLVQAVLFVAYQSDIGNWVVPVGIGLLLLLSLALNRWILPGFGTMANDFLTNLAFYNGTYASSRIAYAADKTFSAAEHTYNYTVSDCNSSVAMQATADGTVTAMYQTQSTVPETHGLAQTVTVPNPVSQTGLAQNLTYAVAKSGYGQTVTVRISKEEDGTSYYQDYTVRLLRQLHLSGLSVATKDETLPFMTTSGGTARFDRDTMDYYVRVDRETTALYISGTYPNSSADTACCGGYYAEVNGVRYDTLAGAEAALNTDLYNEDILVQVCHWKWNMAFTATSP